MDGVVPGTAADDVVSGAAVDGVVAAEARDDVVAGGAHQHVVTLGADDGRRQAGTVGYGGSRRPSTEGHGAYQERERQGRLDRRPWPGCCER